MYHGWLQDSICDLVESEWEIFDQLPYVLVTRLDSSADMASLRVTETIVESEDACGLLGRSLLIADSQLLRIDLRYGLFSHFDEIGLYKERPTMDIPEGLDLGPPLELGAEEPSQALVDWFNSSACVLGLSDGTGMNYMTSSKAIVESLNDRQSKWNGTE